MKLERTKNSKRNIIYGLCNRFLGLFVPFLLRTLIIKLLGTEYLGLNSLFASILQVLSLSELGFGTAIVYSLYKPIAEEDTDKICNLLGLYKRIYQVIGVVISIVGITLIPFLPKLINGTYPDNINITCVYLIYLFNTVSSYFLFAYKRVILTAYQRMDMDDNASSMLHLIIYPIQALVLVLSRNYYLYIIFIPITTICHNIVCSYMVNIKYPDIKPKGSVSIKEAKLVFSKVKYLCIHKFGNTLSSSFDSIIISSVLGLGTLAIYSNYYYISSVILALLTVIYSSFAAGVGNSLVTESVEKNKDIFSKLTFLNSWLQAFCVTSLVCLYQPFMVVWAGENNIFGFDTVICLVILFYVSSSRKIVLGYKDAAGLWKQDKYKPLVGGLVNLCLNIILVKLIGVNGVILSTIISFLCIELPWETKVLFRTVFNETPKKYFIDLMKYAVVNMGICGITFIITMLIKCDGMYGFIVKAIACVIVPNGIFGLYYRNNQYFKYFLDIIKGIVGNIKSKIFVL